MTTEKSFKIATIAYHHVGFTPDILEEARYAVTLDAFKAQMRWLSECPMPVRSLDEATQESANRSTSLVITFDDGFETDHRVALPILKKYGLTAIFFLSPANIGRSGYMTWQQVSELASEGMAIGSHGHDHTLFDQLTNAEITDQVTRSRDTLEERLALPVVSMSLPGGAGGRRAESIARDAGYERVFGSCPTIGNTSDWKAGIIPRIALRCHHDVDDLSDFLTSQRRRAKLAARYLSLHVIRTIVGRHRFNDITRYGTHAIGRIKSILSNND